MANNTSYEKNSEDTALNVISAKLCFENLSNDYKPGYLVVESNVANEHNKALQELVGFASVIVDDVAVNESNSKSTIYVSTVVSNEDDKQKLYEWLEKYAGKENIESIAPGLLESVKEDSVTESEDNSVASRFAKYRKLYEEEEIAEDDEVSEDKKEDETPEETPEETSDDNKEETSDDNKEDDNKEDDSEEDEQDELTAIIIEVKKGDEDKAKDELIEAGVDEDDIEILDNEEEEEDSKDEEKNEDESDEDDKEETVKIKIAVDSFDALKEYLEGKGFNLEDELGGEIVTDDGEDDGDEEGGDEEGGDDNGESMDDAFAGFDDLFADADDSSEEDDK